MLADDPKGGAVNVPGNAPVSIASGKAAEIP
jgi:hypothetical protein